MQLKPALHGSPDFLEDTMELYAINTGFFKLDGGAMFGVVPKVLWSRQIEADANNLCNWAARCLLVEDGARLILIDTGLGDKQSEKFFSYYYRNGDDSLLRSLHTAGFTPADVTDVVLTHLHFDHSGGAVSYAPGTTDPILTFPNADYWVHEAHWNWALQPNPREKASFLEENLLPLAASGHLRYLDPDASPFEHIRFICVNGHTEQMLLPVVIRQNRKLLFAADLVPSALHLPLAWVMGYDVRPLLTMQEKETVLEQVVRENMILFFEHDAAREAALLKKGEKGFVLEESGPLQRFL